MKKFEVGKAYHLVSVKSGDILKVVFVKARLTFKHENFAVITFSKNGEDRVKKVQIDIEGFPTSEHCGECFYLGKHRKKLCRAFFEVRELHCDFSKQKKV